MHFKTHKTFPTSDRWGDSGRVTQLMNGGELLIQGIFIFYGGCSKLYHNYSDLKQHKFMILLFFRLEVWQGLKIAVSGGLRFFFWRI